MPIHEFQVHVRKYSGFLNSLWDFQNSSIELHQPDNENLGGLFPNGSASGILKYLLDESVDVGLNARFFRYKIFQGRVEVTPTVGRDDVCVIVPR